MAATGAIKIGSEITEEELQLFLEPAIKFIVMDVPYDAPNFDEMMETALVTALSTFILEGKSIVQSGLAKPQTADGTVEGRAVEDAGPYGVDGTGRVDAKPESDQSAPQAGQTKTAAPGVGTASSDLKGHLEETGTLNYTYLDDSDVAGQEAAIDNAYSRVVDSGRSVVIPDELLAKYESINKNPALKLKDAIKEFYDKHLKGHSASVDLNGGVITVMFENDGKKKSVGWRMKPDKAATFEYLVELVGGAEYAYSGRNRDPGEASSIPRFRYFVADAVVGGRRVPVKIQVRDINTSARTQETHYYYHNLQNKRGNDSPGADTNSANVNGNAYVPSNQTPQNGASDDSVTYAPTDVNSAEPDYSLPGPESGNEGDGTRPRETVEAELAAAKKKLEFAESEYDYAEGESVHFALERLNEAENEVRRLEHELRRGRIAETGEDVSPADAIPDEGVALPIVPSSDPKVQREFNRAAKIAGNFGCKLVVGVPEGGGDGSYQNGVITINPSCENPVMQVLLHELTHRLENSKQYGRMTELVRRQLTARNVDVEDRVQQIVAQAESRGESMTPGYAMRELVAEYVQTDLFQNEREIQRLLREERSVFDTIRDWLSDAVHWLKGNLGQKRIIRARRLFEKALRTSDPKMGMSGAQHLIETGPKGKYVKADRQVILGNDPDSWRDQIEVYINQKIRRGEDVVLTTEDGMELRLTKNTAGKAGFRDHVKDEKTGKQRPMTDEEYLAKLDAEAHIDELALISEPTNTVPVADEDGKHGDLAKDGWYYRTAFFQDFDGKYYRVTLSVPSGSEGFVVYNVGKMRERSLPTNSGSSAYAALNGEETSFEHSVRQDGGIVNREKSPQYPAYYDSMADAPADDWRPLQKAEDVDEEAASSVAAETATLSDQGEGAEGSAATASFQGSSATYKSDNKRASSAWKRPFYVQIKCRAPWPRSRRCLHRCQARQR